MLVGLFGLQTITSRVATVISRSIAGRSWRSRASSAHRDRARARGRGEVRVDRERRPRVDELGAGLQQRLAGGEQDVAGAVADRDPRRRHAVAVGQALAQRRVGRVGVAVERPERAARSPPAPPAAAGTATRCWPAAPAGARSRVAAGGRIDRDAADALGELERHRPIVTNCRPTRPQRRAIPGRSSAAYRSRATQVGAQRGGLAQVDVPGLVAVLGVVVDQHPDHARQRAAAPGSRARTAAARARSRAPRGDRAGTRRRGRRWR